MVNPKARLGYFYGLNVDRKPHEYPLPTNAEKFQATVGDLGAVYAIGSRLPKKERRMAGDILNLEITKSPGTPESFPLPTIGSAELRVPEMPS